MKFNMPVSAIMTEHVITLHPDDSLNIVEETFAAKPFHHIPIVDVNQRLQGIVSKMDLLQLSAIKKDLTAKEYKFLKVKDFMTRNLVVIEPETSVIRAASIFYKNKFHALPVVKDDRIVGILTTHDLISMAFELVPALSED